ncbi:MAG: AMP-binding protein, partial [Burkholderiales bacterium]|nr:AMP-binding protein [Burkholderiales bacterium]
MVTHSAASASGLPLQRFWPARLPRAITPPATSLWHNLAVSALRYPDKPALVCFDAVVTYAELLAQAERLAAWLHAEGVQAGDRVILLMQNSPQWVAAHFAVLRANAVVVPVNPMNRAQELQHYITDPDVKVAIVAADLAGELLAANAQVPPAQRLSHLLVTHYTDVLPAFDEANAQADLAGRGVPAAWLPWLAQRHDVSALARDRGAPEVCVTAWAAALTCTAPVPPLTAS